MVIKKVGFEGNSSIKESDLKKVVKSKPKAFYDVFSKAARVDPDGLNEDVRAIRELYQGKGYIDVSVAAPRVDRADGKVTTRSGPPSFGNEGPVRVIDARAISNASA